MQHKLIDLYESQYMSSSVKLIIIKALDNTLQLKEGIDWFLGRHPLQLLGNQSNYVVKTDSGDKVLSPYKRYLKMMVTKQVCLC